MVDVVRRGYRGRFSGSDLVIPKKEHYALAKQIKENLERIGVEITGARVKTEGNKVIKQRIMDTNEQLKMLELMEAASDSKRTVELHWNAVMEAITTMAVKVETLEMDVQDPERAAFLYEFVISRAQAETVVGQAEEILKRVRQVVRIVKKHRKVALDDGGTIIEGEFCIES